MTRQEALIEFERLFKLATKPDNISDEEWDILMEYSYHIEEDVAIDLILFELETKTLEELEADWIKRYAPNKASLAKCYADADIQIKKIIK